MILSSGSKLNSCVFSYSDVKLWLSFRIYADSTFNSTYEEYKVRVAKKISKIHCLWKDSIGFPKSNQNTFKSEFVEILGII